MKRTRKTNKPIQIDGKKLADELDKRGVNRNELSAEMGHSRDYVTNNIRENQITPQTMNYLKGVYNIQLEMIAPAKEPEPEQLEITTIEPVKDPAKKTVAEIEASTLYTIIYDATYNAIKAALKEI